MKRIALLLLCLGSLNPVVSGQADAEIQTKLEYAGAEHEIISIFIEEGKYAAILPEFRKILELGLTGKDETLVVYSALTFAESMTEAGSTWNRSSDSGQLHFSASRTGQQVHAFDV